MTLQLPTPATLRKVIYIALEDYRLSNMGDDDQQAYPLVDLVSNDGCTIDTGRAELRILADHLAGALEGKAP